MNISFTLQFFLSIIAFIIVSLNTYASTGIQDTIILKGKLNHKKWSKSTQSYCAQGSDYYVLNRNHKEIVLSFTNDSDKELLAKRDNKKVKLKGILVNRKIAPPTMGQHPVGLENDNFNCEVFEVLRVICPKKP